MLKRRLQRLVQVYTCQNVKLFEISCTGLLLCKHILCLLQFKCCGATKGILDYSQHVDKIIEVETCKHFTEVIITLVNVYVDLVVFTRIAGTS